MRPNTTGTYRQEPNRSHVTRTFAGRRPGADAALGVARAAHFRRHPLREIAHTISSPLVDLGGSAVAFRWGSWTGVACGLFILYGAANLAAAVIVPTLLISGGAGGIGSGGVVFSGDADSYLLGSPLGNLRSSNPKLDTLLVSSMVGMCGQMIAVATLFLAVAWFPFRRGQRWARWARLVRAR